MAMQRSIQSVANGIANTINNSIASSKGKSPVHVKVNDLAKAIDKDGENS
jgi:hypothetical protein